MNYSKIKEWRKFLKDGKEYDFYDYPFETQIPNDKLTIKDIPNPQRDSINKLSFFALTYNTYNLNEFDESKEFFEKYIKNKEFNKNLRSLRSLLFFHQRKCHFSGPLDEDDEKIFKDVINEIREIITNNSNTREELEEPDLKKKQKMYKLYQNIFNSNFLDKKKIGLLNAAFGFEPWGWRVVGITKNAVDLIKKNNGNQNVTKHLVRDHFFQGRNVTYKKMLEKLYNFDDWWKEFWNNDRTILMTKEEHNKIEKIKKNKDTLEKIKKNIYKIDWKKGYFPGASIGYLYSKKKEGYFVINNFR